MRLCVRADEEDRFGPIFSALVYLILSTSLGYYGWRIAAARRRAPSEGSKISFKTVRIPLSLPPVRSSRGTSALARVGI